VFLVSVTVDDVPGVVMFWETESMIIIGYKDAVETGECSDGPGRDRRM